MTLRLQTSAWLPCPRCCRGRTAIGCWSGRTDSEYWETGPRATCGDPAVCLLRDASACLIQWQSHLSEELHRSNAGSSARQLRTYSRLGCFAIFDRAATTARVPNCLNCWRSCSCGRSDGTCSRQQLLDSLMSFAGRTSQQNVQLPSSGSVRFAILRSSQSSSVVPCVCSGAAGRLRSAGSNSSSWLWRRTLWR